jgi:hypothetical protein
MSTPWTTCGTDEWCTLDTEDWCTELLDGPYDVYYPVAVDYFVPVPVQDYFIPQAVQDGFVPVPVLDYFIPQAVQDGFEAGAVAGGVQQC